MGWKKQVLAAAERLRQADVAIQAAQADLDECRAAERLARGQVEHADKRLADAREAARAAEQDLYCAVVPPWAPRHAAQPNIVVRGNITR